MRLLFLPSKALADLVAVSERNALGTYLQKQAQGCES